MIGIHIYNLLCIFQYFLLSIYHVFLAACFSYKGNCNILISIYSWLPTLYHQLIKMIHNDRKQQIQSQFSQVTGHFTPLKLHRTLFKNFTVCKMLKSLMSAYVLVLGSFYSFLKNIKIHLLNLKYLGLPFKILCYYQNY